MGLGMKRELSLSKETQELFILLYLKVCLHFGHLD